MKLYLSFMAYIIFMLLALPVSCAMKQDVYINKSGGGRVVFDIQLATYLTEVLDQLSVFLDSEEPVPEEGMPFFDMEAIREDFRQREGVRLVRLENPTRNHLQGEFAFNDIAKLLQSTEGSAQSHMIRLNRKNNQTLLTVHIDRNTVKALLTENPSLNNPLVENFGPASTEGLSETDYLDMMEFALGEESRLGIKESSLVLLIHVDGHILDQTGGQLLNKTTARYTIPLLSVLMLNKTLEYSLNYR